MLAAFLVGGVPFGLLLAALRGVDVRSAGSGNVGATNAARTAGWPVGLATLLLDSGKGALAATVGAIWGGPTLAAGMGCAAVLGHVFSPFLAFRGGKGVATAAGAFAILDPLALGAALLTFGVVVSVTRTVSLGSVAGALALAAGAAVSGATAHTVGLAFAVAALVVVRHADNLRRLRAGRERRLGDAAPSARPPPGVEASAPVVGAPPPGTKVEEAGD